MYGINIKNIFIINKLGTIIKNFDFIFCDFIKHPIASKIKDVINNLNHQKILDINYDYQNIKIYASPQNILKLQQNAQDYYHKLEEYNDEITNYENIINEYNNQINSYEDTINKLTFQLENCQER